MKGKRVEAKTVGKEAKGEMPIMETALIACHLDRQKGN